LRATLREAIRRKRDTIQPSDLRVYQRGQASRLDIVLTLDLSGTMRQGEKLWHAKEAIGALAGACSLSRDRVGLVTFSNLAHRVLDPVDDPVLVMEKLVDLWIRRNAFTNISHALKTARDSCLQRRLPTTVPHIILISDGQATAPPSGPRESALREAATTHRHEITISCICLLQGSSDVELMRRISRIGRGRLYLVEDVRSLPQVMLEEHGSVRASGAQER
jgi:Mg-chelatase subunit ChlD